MPRARALVPIFSLVLSFAFAALAASPDFQENSGQDAAKQSGSATLKICLRLTDESPFGGSADLRVHSSAGSELHGTTDPDLEGETLFQNLAVGTYTVEANAPGFAPVKQTVEIESGKRTQTLFLILKPDAALAAAKPESAAPAGAVPVGSWMPPGVDALRPGRIILASPVLSAENSRRRRRTNEAIRRQPPEIQRHRTSRALRDRRDRQDDYPPKPAPSTTSP